MKLHRVPLAIIVSSLLVLSAAQAGDWLQFGGPTADFKVADPGLAASWPESGPPEIWSRELGGGYTSIVVRGDRLYTMFRRADNEVVVALDSSTGRTIWEFDYEARPLEHQNLQFGSGPNASPLILGNRLFTVGYLNKMHAFSLESGDLLWSKDLTQEFGTPVSEFGYASSPIAYKDSVMILTGGTKSGAVALDPETGEVTWKAPALPISYDTPEIAHFGGEDQLVFMTPTEVVAISISSAQIAWRHPHKNQWDTNCLGPWFGDDDLVFVGSSGEAGSRTLRVTEGKTEEIASNSKVKPSTGSVIRKSNVVYAATGPTVLAHDIETGEIVWQERGYKDANLLAVGERMLLLDGDGKLSLATLTPKKFVLHSSHQVLEKPSLTAPSLVGTRLYLRDQKRIVALELGSQAHSPTR